MKLHFSIIIINNNNLKLIMNIITVIIITIIIIIIITIIPIVRTIFYFLLFIVFRDRFEVNILHPIIVFSFCDINADYDEGLKFSCHKYSNVFTVFTISNIPSWRKMFSTFLSSLLLLLSLVSMF